MASGNPVVEIIRDLSPASSAAPLTARAGGSSPAESLTCWAFDAAAIEYTDFLCRLSEDYDAGGLTFTLPWMAASATSGDTVWGVAIRRFADDAEDADAAHTYDFNDVTDTAASASGEFSYPTVAFTDGAYMDSWGAGEYAIVRVRRNATSGSDTMTGDAQLIDLTGKET